MAGKKSRTRRAVAPEPQRHKTNRLTALGIGTIDYKDTHLLRTFISERGKIRSRRVTGVTPQQQRQIALAVKNAREMALLPFAATQ
jgi:small subunit ribosomal protein S18